MLGPGDNIVVAPEQSPRGDPNQCSLVGSRQDQTRVGTQSEDRPPLQTPGRRSRRYIRRTTPLQLPSADQRGGSQQTKHLKPIALQIVERIVNIIKDGSF